MQIVTLEPRLFSRGRYNVYYQLLIHDVHSRAMLSIV